MGQQRTFRDRESVFSQGDPGAEMYGIVEGSVDIYRETDGQEVHLARLEAGSHFGEMALLLDEPRSACARAVGQTVVEAIDRAEFRQMPAGDPLAWDLLTQMAGRIRDVDVKVEELGARRQYQAEALGSFIASRKRFY